MFTGIVQATVEVVAINRQSQLHEVVLALPANLRDGLVIGASVAVNGVCLTVTRLATDGVAFDVMMETLRVTNLADLVPGQRVNVERAARFGDEIGGHLLSGHVHGKARIESIETPENNRVITFSAPDALMKYILPKGFAALNGCSLTIGEVSGNRFNVYLIPETLRMTTFGTAREGDWVNLEIDSQTQAVVDTVERVLAQRDAG